MSAFERTLKQHLVSYRIVSLMAALGRHTGAPWWRTRALAEPEARRRVHGSRVRAAAGQGRAGLAWPVHAVAGDQ